TCATRVRQGFFVPLWCYYNREVRVIRRDQADSHMPSDLPFCRSVPRHSSFRLVFEAAVARSSRARGAKKPLRTSRESRPASAWRGPRRRTAPPTAAREASRVLARQTLRVLTLELAHIHETLNFSRFVAP